VKPLFRLEKNLARLIIESIMFPNQFQSREMVRLSYLEHYTTCTVSRV
jgi:hypothetical protein